MSSKAPKRKLSNKQDKLAALKSLREFRELGLKRSEVVEEESSDESMYDYMSEEEYQERVKKLRESDFVVDDDGTGYVDNYDDNEEFGGRAEAEEGAMEEGESAAGSKKRKGKGKEEKSHKLSAMFSKIATSSKRKDAVGLQKDGGKNKVEKEAEASLKDDSLDSMLRDLVAGTVESAKKKSKRSSEKKMKKKSKRHKSSSKGRSFREELENLSEDDEATGYDHGDVGDDGGFDDVDDNHYEPHNQNDQTEGNTDIESQAKASKTESSDVEGECTNKTVESSEMDVDKQEEVEDKEGGGEEEKVDEEAKPTMADMKAKLLAAARSRPVRAAPKQAPPPTPATPPRNKDAAGVTFMATPPASFSEIDCGKDESGWTLKPQVSDDASNSSESASSSATAQVSKPTLATEEDGSTSLDFYFMDMYEDPINNKGTVFLFGKAWDESTKQFLSCSIEVKNISRVLYVLPRKSCLSAPEKSVEFNDVLEEIRTKVIDKILPVGSDGSRAFKCKPTDLKYAFELPEVPRESTRYLEVHYPMCAEKDIIDRDFEGETFARIFGTNQSAIEQLVLTRELKGPMWLRIKNVTFPESSQTWCKFHGTITTPRQITPLQKVLLEKAGGEGQSLAVPPPPTMRVMSLSLKTIVNPETHEHEIVAISGLVRDNVDLVGTTPNYNKNSEVKAFTIVRGGKGNISFPLGFKELVKKAAPHVSVQNNERALLSFLLVQLQRVDPDVLLGHNIRQFDLDVLLARMKANQVGTWSKLGRLRLSKMPFRKADGGGYFSSTNLTPGRLLLDTYVTAKELLLGQRSYTLTELCRTQLDRSRMEIQPAQVPYFFQSKELLLKLISVSEADAWLTLLLSFKLEAMPLTHQLSTLAGNLWSRTLSGGRAERIEYLLLHEFFRRGYILPDRQGGGKKKNNGGNNSNNKGGAKSKSASRKPKYDGGLVLEPKKGLYDKFILLLDFNSLYPSIIQEYNICYTTVERTLCKVEADQGEEKVAGSHHIDIGEDGEDHAAGEVQLEEGEELPPLPDLSVHTELAVVPSLIRTLVDRRKTVKQQLKTEKDAAKRAQLDVRQKALKLTANSMYGCLGFTGFRFFARPVAALVTAQGRSILQNTVDITQTKLGYEVVYGDTDSIMVNTNSTDIDLAKQIATRIKVEINKLYKLLEIEQDGIFKTLLLLKKKKYAALAIKETTGTDGRPQITTDKETKGLDLVRRDWCPLSKRVGHTVLDHILSGKSYDEIVEGIHEYLESIQVEIKENKVELEEFIITKGLNKAPKDYPDAKSQPHLNVALAMVERGKPVNTGDHIPYVICTLTRQEYIQKLKDIEQRKEVNEESGENQSKDEAGDVSLKPKELTPKSNTSYAERAFHPEEIKAAPEGILKVDLDWYLKQQIVPPTQRLCDPIQGTSAAQIALHLGLDPGQFQNHYDHDDQDNLLNIADISDSDRFRGCTPVKITCHECALGFNFPPGGVFMPEEYSTAIGSGEVKEEANMSKPNACVNAMVCPSCKHEIDPTTLENLLHLSARAAIKRYYEGWLVADDPSVELRTRQQSVSGRSFVLNGRRLQLRAEYGPGQLYTQLKYLESLMDNERAEKEIERLNRKRSDPYVLPRDIQLSQKQNLKRIQSSFQHEFIETSAYNWVQPDLFKLAFHIK